MALVLFQAIVLCTFAYLQINEGLDIKAAAPTAATKIGLNITSLSFLSPIMSKITKYSTTVKNFVQKKLDEMRIIYSGLVAAVPTGSPMRLPGAPVMQVTRPLAAPAPTRRLSDTTPANNTK